MSGNNQHTSNEVSALETTLKLLKNAYKRVINFLGIVVIDKGMRSIVTCYDKNHNKKSSRQRIYNNDENNDILKQQFQDLEKTNKQLIFSIQQGQKRIEGLSSQITFLEDNLNKCKQDNAKLSSDKQVLIQNNIELTNLNNNLLSRCMPETEIPVMIYYAQGDASGLYLRKVSAIRSAEHIYTLYTLQGNACVAKFLPLAGKDSRDIIINRNLTLIACEIISIAPNSSNIRVIEPGKVIFENNKWKVINKAKIELV